jgi:DNA-binding transcriptional MerR regulator
VKADSEMTEATQRHRLASQQRDQLKADIERLEQQQVRASPNSPQVAQIDAQLQQLNDSYARQLEALTTHQSAVFNAGRKYMRIKQELALLPRT